MTQSEILLHVEDLRKYFPIRRGLFQTRVGDVKAVDGVSFDVLRGETMGLVGESGCGKTTAGRTIIRLYRPTGGKVCFGDVNLAELDGYELRQVRRRMQMIFQDPFASLNPRMNVEDIVAEPLGIHKVARSQEKTDRVAELLDKVGLKPSSMSRYPHEFSGGQCQRIGIARSLAMNPDLIICDEPISSLDVSIQAQVVNLMKDLQDELGLTYVFIAHDLSMVRHISDRIAVMYLGKLVELASKTQIHEKPLHPYTRALLSAVPVPDPFIEETRERIILEGDPPSPSSPPKGCNFNTRCPEVRDVCFEIEPEFVEVEPGHFCACHLVRPTTRAAAAG